MGGSSQRRPGIAPGAAFAAEAVSLAVGFALAEPTTLIPDHSTTAAAMPVLFAAGFGTAAALAFALHRRESGTAWWATASGTALLAVMVLLLESGAGAWFTWCAVALLSSFAGIAASHARARRSAPEKRDRTATAPGRFSGKAATALGAVVLVASLCSGAGMDDVDYSGTWTAREGGPTLTLSSGSPGQREEQGNYTLQWGACTEKATWHLYHPLMTNSVQVWLERDTATPPAPDPACLPDAKRVKIYVEGGTAAAPVLGLTGPGGKNWALTRK
ncbi:hypothetical protein [Streptomyces sp. NPDC056491]|uniref:hypothetical protein n=1 Tax=Streptomyces sp. NPDC056491 TaxID=3345837 RepID=UPI00367A65BF